MKFTATLFDRAGNVLSKHSFVATSFADATATAMALAGVTGDINQVDGVHVVHG